MPALSDALIKLRDKTYINQDLREQKLSLIHTVEE
jgi:hypothetical protein